MERIKLAIWFTKHSKEFTGYGYLRMLFKEHLVKRCICFVKQSMFDKKMNEKYGESYYAMVDRTLEIEV